MRTFIFSLFLIISLFSCRESEDTDEFLIQGYITGYFEGKVVLAKYRNGSIENIDSVFMTKSKFKFKNVKIETPELYYLIIDDGKIIIEFFTDKNHIQINADYNKKSELEVIGSEAHKEYVSFLENNVVYQNKQKEIDKQRDIALENNDTKLLNQLDSMYTANYKDQINFMYSYVIENNNSYVSAFIASESLTDHVSLEQLNEIYINFSDTVKNSPYYKELGDKIEIRKIISEGHQAPDFTLDDTAGIPHSLSSLQGSYVLLDFAASWHGPSRSRNPELKELYKKFHPRGFEIFQVSLERSKEEWTKIINTDGISWMIVSDINGIESEVSDLYGIRSIPMNFLLDKEGIIIRKDLSPEDLEKILENIL